MAGCTRFSISVVELLLQQFDTLTRKEGFPTRSGAISDCMLQQLVAKEWLTGIQHDFGKIIAFTQHIHLDHDNCLELIIVRGEAGQIRELVARLNSAKGVKHRALVMTTTGEEVR